MTEAGNLGMARRGIGFFGLGLAAWLVVLLALGLVFAPGLRAAGPYEPNDTLANAAGPLAGGQAYTGGIESQGDLDYFFFYVTSRSEAQVTLTVANLGGGAGISNIDATILDSSATPVGGLSYITRGHEKATTVALDPGRYFIEVRSSEGFGDAYSLTGGGAGAFGPYETIAGRCAAAMTTTAKARRGLRRKQAKLQHATARLRRSRYSGRSAQRKARAVYRRARRGTKAKRNQLKAARKSQQPWCSIPQ